MLAFFLEGFLEHVQKGFLSTFLYVLYSIDQQEVRQRKITSISNVIPELKQNPSLLQISCQCLILQIVRKLPRSLEPGQSKFNQLVKVTAFYLISDSNQQQFRCRKNKECMCQISKWQIFQENHQFLRLFTGLGISYSDHLV